MDGTFDTWRPGLLELCDAIRQDTRGALRGALDSGELERVARPLSVGAGDVTYGLDLPSEERIAAWHRTAAARSPLSVMTEDAGWNHLGPDAAAAAGVRELPGFDHGGPRIAFDPVDGTRNLMTDLRSAWTVVSFAGPGAGPPTLADQAAGIVSELPTSTAGEMRCFVAERGGPCELATRALAPGSSAHVTGVHVDDDDRVDHGYFPFFRYMPDMRPAIAELEARFFARLAEHEGADVRNCYDDQYITSAGHLVMLMSGTYRFVCDARAFLAERRGEPTITSKPYDLAGALVCAESAGVPVTAPDGSPLAFEIDTETPVSYVGYANAVTRARLEPHWLAVAGLA